MVQLASVIIPCYNAERWVAEAVQSCLDQTHRPLEIIVVDDGSTDRSVEILKGFGSRIILEAGPHVNGNHARNRGIALASGQYFQFLDADDYLLPDKIARQVEFLEQTGADVVYGDWYRQHHMADGTQHRGKTIVPGEYADPLAMLLCSHGLLPLSLLYRRESVLRSGGWDETLPAAQDWDFILSVVLSGVRLRYQPGCHAVYRVHGICTVSTSNPLRLYESCCTVLDKYEKKLAVQGRLTRDYKSCLALSHFILARNYYGHSRAKFREHLRKAHVLCPGFQPNGTLMYRWARCLLGYEATEGLASLVRRFRSNWLHGWQ